MTEFADLDSHPIRGYYPPTGQAISLPLVSEILHPLYMGGCIDGVRLDDSYDVVYSLYPWEKYALGPTTERVEVQMYDSNVVETEVVHDVADQVVAAFRAGRKTLVHCQAGINRSGMVTALALMKMGRSVEEAIALLRERRGEIVLVNVDFVRWLHAQVEETPET